jgi:hypothetical protein
MRQTRGRPAHAQHCGGGWAAAERIPARLRQPVIRAALLAARQFSRDARS